MLKFYFKLTALITLFIQDALTEDIGSGDITTLATVSNSQTGEAICYVKEDCIIAGIALASMICKQVDPDLMVNFNYKDGDQVNAGSAIGKIQGAIHSILKLERLLLNCMQRMSAIASKTNHFVKLVAPYHVNILDTRKTTPNFRVCEKWAVKIGGGVNHRMGLSDQILIKDNHIQAAGGIKNAIESCIKYVAANNLMTPVIVEVKNLEEFNIAKEYDIIDRILIDNFKPNDIVALLKHNTTNKIIEASGGINESNIVSYAETGINYISLGDLTHHINSVDISLKIV
jgi:nicotinate-nucleotide pyrophosphorylase (carboxylating)